MGCGATGATWDNVKEHRSSKAWKDFDVEKVKCRIRSNSLTNVFITKVTNIERNTAAKLWVGNSVSLTGRIIKEGL